MPISTHEISRLSIALVERRVTAFGLGPADRSSDRRIHLVLGSGRAEIGIQVKGNAEPKPGGGKGKLALDWWVDEDTPADVIAFVDLSTDRIWLMKREEVARLAQQRSSGRYHLYMYVDPTAVLRRGNHDNDFNPYLFEHRADLLLRQTRS